MGADMVQTSAPLPAITVDTAKEVIRLSELYLDGTLRLSLAADARAAQITNMLAGTATVLLGIGLVNLLDNVSAARTALGAASLCCGLLFLVALLYSARTIRPRQFNIGGTLRGQWSDDELVGDLALALINQARVYETQAYENIAILGRNAKRIHVCLTIFVAAIPVSAIVGAIVYGLITCNSGGATMPTEQPPKPVQTPREEKPK